MTMYPNYEVKSNLAERFIQATGKLLVSALLLYGAIYFIPQLIDYVEQVQQKKTEPLKIRVIANSSSPSDQQTKQQVVETIQAVVNNNVHIEQNEQFFQEVLHSVQKNFSSDDISLKVGDNLFPPKYQFNHFYPQNNYYSAVFTIGSGRGENWFCSVFPTVCVPPDQQKDEQVKFVVYEWIKEKIN